MTASNWPASLKLVLESEGGYVNRADDRGGPTNFGITQRTYDAYRMLKLQPVRSVELIEATEVSNIYYSTYWEPFCNRYPAGVDYLVFDFAVNAGPHRANVTLQRAIGVADDGIIGPITMEMLGRWRDLRTLVEIYTQLRLEYYIHLNQPQFEAGWRNRANFAEGNALKMVGALG